MARVKAPQQTYDTQRLIRVRVRGTQEQVVKVIDWLKATHEAERKERPDSFGVQLGFIGPVGGSGASQWACHFTAGSYLELQIAKLMRDMGIEQE
jgi:hypothetical protein